MTELNIQTSPTPANDIRYDPYDTAIDLDPYPVWRRMRDQAPLYYNTEHEFYALSRFHDVERALGEWQTYSSARGTVLEFIKADVRMPGSIIFEDPPEHTQHRNLLRRVFTPRSIAALEPRIRELCAQALDPYVGERGFDLIRDLGAIMPMQVIAELLGIPKSDQQAVRDNVDEVMRRSTDSSNPVDIGALAQLQSSMFEDYIDWRETHPSDDLMTQLLNSEYENPDGSTSKLSRQEVLAYVNLLAAAGNETTTRLIGWSGQLLADHPQQRRILVEEPTLIGNAIEEILRFEAPSPVQARYVTRDVSHHGHQIPAGSVMLLLNASANRDERAFDDPDRFDVRRKVERHLSFGYSIHFCLGAALARLEGRIALEELISRFPDWHIERAAAMRAHTSTVRGWERLPLVTS